MFLDHITKSAIALPYLITYHYIFHIQIKRLEKRFAFLGVEQHQTYAHVIIKVRHDLVNTPEVAYGHIIMA